MQSTSWILRINQETPGYASLGSVQAWIVVHWEDARAPGADSYSCAFDSNQCASLRRLHAGSDAYPGLRQSMCGFQMALFAKPLDNLPINIPGPFRPEIFTRGTISSRP